MMKYLSIEKKRIAAIILLLVVGTGALSDGYSFMMEPSGVGIGLTADYIQKSPFSNFLIPGIVLFFLIGVFNIIASILAFSKAWHHEDLIFLQGIILMGWISVQVLLVRDIHLLHTVCFGIGIALTRIGRELKMSHGANA